LGAFSNEIKLELGERAKDMKDQFASARRGIDVLG
jgi:hypothetical protein